MLVAVRPPTRTVATTTTCSSRRPFSWPAGPPDTGVVVTLSVLPTRWNQALNRICRDVPTRPFNGTIAAIDFAGVHQTHPDPYEPDVPDYIWLSSSIRPEGDVGHGPGHDGEGVVAATGEERITETCAQQLQDQIARAGIQWPADEPTDP